MSVSQVLDRSRDYCTNINESAVVDQKKSDQLMENKFENEQDNKSYMKYTEKVL